MENDVDAFSLEINKIFHTFYFLRLIDKFSYSNTLKNSINNNNFGIFTQIRQHFDFFLKIPKNTSSNNSKTFFLLIEIIQPAFELF